MRGWCIVNEWSAPGAPCRTRARALAAPGSTTSRATTGGVLLQRVPAAPEAMAAANEGRRRGSVEPRRIRLQVVHPVGAPRLDHGEAHRLMETGCGRVRQAHLQQRIRAAPFSRGRASVSARADGRVYFPGPSDTGAQPVRPLRLRVQPRHAPYCSRKEEFAAALFPSPTTCPVCPSSPTPEARSKRYPLLMVPVAGRTDRNACLPEAYGDLRDRRLTSPSLPRRD